MDNILMIQHKMIIEKCTELLKVVLNDDIKTINEILERSKEKIDKYNDEKLTVLDLSNREEGYWMACVKRFVHTKWTKHIINEIRLNKNDDNDYVDFICGNDRIYKKNSPVGSKYNSWFYADDDDDCWIYDESNLCRKCKAEYKRRNEAAEKVQINRDKIRDYFVSLCEKTTFSQFLKTQYILLHRKNDYYGGSVSSRLMYREITNVIKIGILNEFYNQNKLLIKKMKDEINHSS